jgi:hypothetical protein
LTDSPSQPPAPRRRNRRCILDDPARVITAKWPRCRECGSRHLRTTDTIAIDGDLVTRRVTCRDCGTKQALQIF